MKKTSQELITESKKKVSKILSEAPIKPKRTTKKTSTRVSMTINRWLETSKALDLDVPNEMHPSVLLSEKEKQLEFYPEPYVHFDRDWSWDYTGYVFEAIKGLKDSPGCRFLVVQGTDSQYTTIWEGFEEAYKTMDEAKKAIKRQIREIKADIREAERRHG